MNEQSESALILLTAFHPVFGRIYKLIDGPRSTRIAAIVWTDDDRTPARIETLEPITWPGLEAVDTRSDGPGCVVYFVYETQRPIILQEIAFNAMVSS